MNKNFKKKNKHNHHEQKREGIDLKSQLKTVKTEVKNGVFVFTSPLSILELADHLKRSTSEIIKYFFLKGKAYNINSVLDEEQIGELCLEFNFDFEKKTQVDETNLLDNLVVNDDESKLVKRPPIITIMGHVDHGKTTLLDTIRKTNVTASEAGGITQHIGAYQISHNGNLITFIDTPGHEAFTEIRARGAQVTDIVVLVVAADDGLMPQTEEAIDHAKAANVPIIVFVNKMDKPNVNPDRLYQQLSEKEIMPEEWGGSNIFIKGSALKAMNIDKLLEAITLIAEVNDYKANPDRLALGVCLESSMDKGHGPCATVLIKNGTLIKGDYVLIGKAFGRVRNMFDENGKEVQKALPSRPVKITGINAIPNAGDKMVVINDEKQVKELAKKMNDHSYRQHFIDLANHAQEAESSDGIKSLNIILRTDVNGSLEAIKHLLSKIAIEGTKLNIIRSTIGNITESDIRLAMASRALIIGFNIRPNKMIKDLADQEKVTIYFFDIIYKLKEAIEKLLLGSLDPIIEEKVTGEAVVKQIWRHSEVGTIAGCAVTSGEITRNSLIRVIRDGVIIYKTKIGSLRRGKENVNKVLNNTECGITLVNYNDLKENDVLEAYKSIEKNLLEDYE